MESLRETLVPLSLALLASLALGRAASRLGVPRVTIYLLVGLLLGPHALLRLFEPDGAAGRLLLGPATEGPLQAVEQLAIGFILFGIGAAFRFTTFRREGPRILALSGAEIATTGVLVGLAVYAGTGDWRLGVVAPGLAIASAPSATLVTLREVEADGPASRSLVLCVGHNNLAVLLGFPLLVSIAFGTGDALAATGFALLALAGGGALGFAAAVWLESITGRRELVLLGILVVLAALGTGRWMDPASTGLGMLACFAAGMALANSSPHADSLFRYLENTVYPLYVLFFVAAGRDLHIEALAQAGALGALFIGARGAGKIVGAWGGLRLAGWQEHFPAGLGAGLLCQAGIALGFVGVLEAVAPGPTETLRHVVVASVVVFELLGPWLLRRTVVAAGEVTLANLYPQAEATGPDAFRWVLLEMRRNLGLLRADVAPQSSGPTVAHAMRRRVEALPENVPFERVLKALGETGAGIVPVRDAEGRFKGVISYEDVKNTLYDPVLRGLVIADDLVTAVTDALVPGSSLADALEVMDRRRVHSWPVVEGDRLAGIVRRADVYGLMRRTLRQESNAGARERSEARSPKPRPKVGGPAL